MSKKKSITIFSVVGVVLAFLIFLCTASFEVGIHDFSGMARNIKLGLDLKGGVYAVYDVHADEELSSDEQQARVDGTIKSMQQLLYDKGYSEAIVSYSSGKIRVEVPDVEDPEAIFDLIGRPAKLEIRDAEGNVLVEGSDLSESYVTTDQDNPGKFAIGIEFNEEGKDKFAKATTDNLNKQLFFFINGQDAMGGITVNKVIADGKAVITGGYDYQTAYDFSVRIQSGAFGVGMTLSETKTISPTLGQDAITMGLVAAAIGIILIFIFMIATYGVFGAIADLALVVYVILLTIVLAIVPWVQLTLEGMAGIVLGIGMAVDANIIIFERIKDEYRNGKPIMTSIKNGFSRATAAVVDGNVTTIIGAIVLYVFGSPSIKGFALTLGISIIISMFTALVVTRLFIKLVLPFNSTNPQPYKLRRLEVE